MFKKGEYVVHGRSGVCVVDSITTIDMSDADKDQKYYVLVPVKTPESKIFFPVDNDRIVLRPILTKNQARKVLRDMKKVEPVFIANDRQREVVYKEAIASCDCMKLAEIIKTLQVRSKEREKQGKRNTFVDDRYLKEAKDFLNHEFSIALEIDLDDIEEYIIERIK